MKHCDDSLFIIIKKMRNISLRFSRKSEENVSEFPEIFPLYSQYCMSSDVYNKIKTILCHPTWKNIIFLQERTLFRMEILEYFLRKPSHLVLQ